MRLTHGISVVVGLGWSMLQRTLYHKVEPRKRTTSLILNSTARTSVSGNEDDLGTESGHMALATEALAHPRFEPGILGYHAASVIHDRGGNAHIGVSNVRQRSVRKPSNCGRSVA